MMNCLLLLRKVHMDQIKWKEKGLILLAQMMNNSCRKSDYEFLPLFLFYILK